MPKRRQRDEGMPFVGNCCGCGRTQSIRLVRPDVYRCDECVRDGDKRSTVKSHTRTNQNAFFNSTIRVRGHTRVRPKKKLRSATLEKALINALKHLSEDEVVAILATHWLSMDRLDKLQGTLP